jgi:hypothetical protein
MTNDASRASSAEETRRTLRGCVVAFGVLLSCAVWFFGAHRLVQSFVSACDAVSPGMFVGSAGTILFGTVLFFGYGVGTYSISRRLRRGSGLAAVGAALVIVVGISLVTWLYVDLAIQWLSDDTLMRVNCPDGGPAWWPAWFPQALEHPWPVGGL